MMSFLALMTPWRHIMCSYWKRRPSYVVSTLIIAYNLQNHYQITPTQYCLSLVQLIKNAMKLLIIKLLKSLVKVTYLYLMLKMMIWSQVKIKKEIKELADHGDRYSRSRFFHPRTKNRFVKDVCYALDETNYYLQQILKRQK